MRDSPPILRPPPPEIARAFRGILESLYANLRLRPMGAARTIAGAAGAPVEEELQLSHRCEHGTLAPMAEALDRAVRGDAALWAGYDGVVYPNDHEAVFGWPRWISLRLFE